MKIGRTRLLARNQPGWEASGRLHAGVLKGVDVGDVLKFSDGKIVDTRPWATGDEALALENGVWVPAEGRKDIPWDDLQDAIVLSDQEIAELPERNEPKDSGEDLKPRTSLGKLMLNGYPVDPPVSAFHQKFPKTRPTDIPQNKKLQDWAKKNLKMILAVALLLLMLISGIIGWHMGWQMGAEYILRTYKIPGINC